MTLCYEDAKRALRSEAMPAALVDLDAFDRNLERHLAVARAHGLPLRVATKSLRVPALIARVLAEPGTRGLMCTSAREACALADAGHDDLFVAYPPHGAPALDALCERVAAGLSATLAVDSLEGGRALAQIAERHQVELAVAICADMSLRFGGGRVHIGVRRSPLADVDAVVALAEGLRPLRGLRVRGLMGYEAQVAGLGDDSAFDPRVTRIGKRLMRRLSMAELGRRRRQMAEALDERGFDLAFVNGGGTGSLTWTTAATGVTEVTAGSGLFKPLLFDGYADAFVRSLEPSAFFALEVTRRPAPGMVTCFGGGYVASGAAGPDRLPRPFAPSGLSLLDLEGAGEVQTPLAGKGADGLALGDPVLMRHAKAGELFEHFDEVLLVRGETIVDRVPTYRGAGIRL